MAKEKIAPDEPTPKKSKENLVPCIAVNGFTDGNLTEAFAEYGYRPEWPRGERRELPYWLIKRCEGSGAEIQMLVK